MPVEPFFRSDTDVVALQTSDLTAWMIKNSNENGLGKFEWLWDSLAHIVRSPMSRLIDDEWILGMYGHEQTQEELMRKAAG
jgi:hypothetical protein